jgi:hypothetical protein
MPPIKIEGFDSLAELALDMRSSWNHAADTVWREHRDDPSAPGQDMVILKADNAASTDAE